MDRLVYVRPLKKFYEYSLTHENGVPFESSTENGIIAAHVSW